jgi:hypothetical protein
MDQIHFAQMGRIPTPTVRMGDPGRAVCCQEALEPEFQAFLERAGSAGWLPEETLATLINLADIYAIVLLKQGSLDSLWDRVRKPNCIEE